MNLIKASSEHFQSIIELYERVRAHLSHESHFFNWSSEAVRSEFQNSIFYILIDTDLTEKTHQVVVTSCVCWRDSGDFFEILSLCTDPDYRQKGLMKELLSELLVLSREASKPILLEVHEHNMAAQSLYFNLGFQLIHKRSKYYSDLSDALIFKFHDHSN